MPAIPPVAEVGFLIPWSLSCRSPSILSSAEGYGAFFHQQQQTRRLLSRKSSCCFQLALLATSLFPGVFLGSFCCQRPMEPRLACFEHKPALFLGLCRHCAASFGPYKSTCGSGRRCDVTAISRPEQGELNQICSAGPVSSGSPVRLDSLG